MKVKVIIHEAEEGGYWAEGAKAALMMTLASITALIIFYGAETSCRIEPLLL